MPKKTRDPNPVTGEEDLIARFFAPLANGADEALGLLDDAACLPPKEGQEFVLTADGLVAGEHFFATDPAEDVAYKALAVNVSDLIAKGAAPYRYLLTLALPRVDQRWLSAFSSGLAKAQTEFGCQLIGGDTVKTGGPLTLSITAIGLIPAGAMIVRDGGKAGDAVYLSGEIGDAALGLALARRPERAEMWGLTEAQTLSLLERHKRPCPRLGLVAALRAHASAAMDVSDGLLGDFETLCRCSRTGGEIEADRLPLTVPARRVLERDPSAMARIATGGDDYEILTTIPADHTSAFEADAAAAGIQVTRIGQLTARGADVGLRAADGKLLAFERAKFDHFDPR